MKKNFKLDPEEQEIENAIERGEYKPVPKQSHAMEAAWTAARDTLAKKECYYRANIGARPSAS